MTSSQYLFHAQASRNFTSSRKKTLVSGWSGRGLDALDDDALPRLAERVYVEVMLFACPDDALAINSTACWIWRGDDVEIML